MTLEQIVHCLETGLARLFRRPEPATARDEAERVAAELEARQQILEGWERDLAALRQRLADRRLAEARLTAAVESCLRDQRPHLAWKNALELERLRQEVADDQARLPRLEQTCWSLRFQLRQMARQLERLQQRLAERPASAPRRV
jgi:hypothetical protein